MTERTRNLAVGMTVIVALVLLGGLIVLFTGVPTLFHRGYKIRILLPHTAETQAGDSVHAVGMVIGKVTNVRFTNPEDFRKGVTLTAEIRYSTNLPGNVIARVYKKNIVGGAYLELVPMGDIPIDPQTGKPMEFLPKDRIVTIEGELVTGSMLPDELRTALKSLAKLAENLNTLIEPAPAAAQPTTDSAEVTTATQPSGLRRSLDNLDTTLAGLAKVFGDEDNQKNIKKSLKELADASSKASEAIEAMKDFANQAQQAAKEVSATTTKTQGQINELMHNLIEDAQQASKLLATVNRIALRFESGKGTAAKLIQDPKLYNNLVDATNQLRELLQEFQQLTEAWRKKGIKVKM